MSLCYFIIMKHVYINTEVNLKEIRKHLRCNVSTKGMSI